MSDALDSKALAENSEWVKAALDADQLSAAKAKHYPRRKLKPGETLLFWALRIYLFFMLGIVLYQVWIAAH